MENLIVIGVLIAIVGGIVFYLLRAKKKGKKCIGCPYASQCQNTRGCGCGQEKK